MLDKGQTLIPEGGRILDYGCGKGMVVEEGLNRDLDCYGVEAFAQGSGTTIMEYLERKQLLGCRVKELEGFKIPFPDGYFDLVVANQVFEHVVNLPESLEEISRVLSPRGKLLCLFPTKEVIKEGHCGILFAHWLPKSELRFYWLMICRFMGFGRLKHKKGARKWATFFNKWLDESVTYRNMQELNQDFSQYFEIPDHIESEYLHFRFSRKKSKILPWVVTVLPFNFILAWLYRKWAGVVLVLSKQDLSDSPVEL